MKKRIMIQLTAEMAALVLAWMLWPAGKPHSIEQVQQPPAPNVEQRTASTVVAEAPESSNTTAPAPTPAKSERRVLTTSRPQPAARRPSEVRVDANRVLASINQTQIQLRHLMAVQPEETEKELTAEEYESRLERAIEMELTFQAARDQGVQLTPAQQQRVEQIAGGSKADLEHYQKFGLTWSSSRPEQVEFEKTVLAAQMLEQNLVARKAAVSPSANPEIQARYEQARRELLAQLQASASITRIGPAL